MVCIDEIITKAGHIIESRGPCTQESLYYFAQEKEESFFRKKKKKRAGNSTNVCFGGINMHLTSKALNRTRKQVNGMLVCSPVKNSGLRGCSFEQIKKMSVRRWSWPWYAVAMATLCIHSQSRLEISVVFLRVHQAVMYRIKPTSFAWPYLSDI